MVHKHAWVLAVVAGSLLFGSFAWAMVMPPTRAPEAKSGALFSDVAANHPFIKTLEDLKRNGLIKGYADGTFAPDTSVTRAEFITMVMAGTGSDLVDQGCFKDVPKGEWFSKFVCTAKSKKLIDGYADGSFKPYNNINFAEASAIIAKAYKLNPGKAKKSDPWYKPAVKKLEARAAIPTTVDFMEKNISRSETGEIIWRLKSKIKNRPTKTFETLTASLPTIASCPELQEKIAVYQYQQSKNRPRIMYDIMPRMEMAVPMMDATGETAEGEEGLVFSEPMMEKSAEPAPSPTGAADFSTTNVQVAGVDEGDIVKNDGSHIYIISRGSVRVIKAAPPEEMQEVSKLGFGDGGFTPNDVYVTADKLIVLGRSSARTKVYVYAMDAERKLTEERAVAFDGSMISSRRIGNRLYLVMRHNPDMYRIMYMSAPTTDEEVQKVLPFFEDSVTGKEMPVVPCSSVRFFPQYQDFSQTVVASFDVSDPKSEVKNAMVMGAGNTVYASLESLYVAGTRRDYPVMEKFDVWAPPSSGKEKTVLFRFALNTDGGVEFKTTGEVPGHPLNQFSLDEEGTALRIAVTEEKDWSNSAPSQNHLYILDRENLGTVLGKIENIAPNEKIYSVRFLGKRAYMVTFKFIDPFFVIDVEDPRNPKILGELKIPGYSDYLHPYDENHVIGFGKDVDASIDADKVHTDDAVYYTAVKGMKMGLFDVTDVANPKELFKEVIGDRGTESELLRDHKALLYDKARNLFAFPVTVSEVRSDLLNELMGGARSGREGEPVFQGAYVYTLDLENGFKLKGKVTHYTSETFKKSRNYFSSDDRYNIKRIVSIGDYFYTVSMGMLKAVKREDMSEAKVLDLQLPEYGRGWEPYWGGDVIID